MKSIFVEKQIPYDGTQLRSHWILDTLKLHGDVIAAFMGPADVKIEQMVDLEDVIGNKPIYSEMMLHFIVEHFQFDLEKTVLCQRLLISQIQQELNGTAHLGHPSREDRVRAVVRKGDDLFIGRDKLTVSIATTSPVSCLIHTGINISSKNTPVPTKGLHDFDVNPERFGRTIMRQYVEEIEGVKWAACKVRSVK